MTSKIECKQYCMNCSFQSDLPHEVVKHWDRYSHHIFSTDPKEANKYPIEGIPSEQVLYRLEELIEFLKFDSIGGTWNSVQLLEMLKDLFSEKPKSPYKVDETKPWIRPQ